MQRFIRKSVFETNSSSSHSLTVSDAPLRDMSSVAGALKSGVLRVDVKDHFGWEWRRYYKPENKMAYLLSQICSEDMERQNGRGDISDELRQESDSANHLIKTVEKALGVKVEVHVHTDYPGIDHDSQGVGTEVLSNSDRLLDFLFDPKSCVLTGNDNSSMPAMIKSDRGDLEMSYPDHYTKKLPEDGLKVSLETVAYGDRMALNLPDGEQILIEDERWVSHKIGSEITDFTVTRVAALKPVEKNYGFVTTFSGRSVSPDTYYSSPEYLREAVSTDLHAYMEEVGRDASFGIHPDVQMDVSTRPLKEREYLAYCDFILEGQMSPQGVERFRQAVQNLLEARAENDSVSSPGF